MSTKFQRDQGFRDGAVVSLSGGIDSATALGVAISRYGVENVIPVAFHYGQKHDAELMHAQAVAKWYGLGDEFQIIELPQIFGGAGSTLIDTDSQVQMMGTYEELKDKFNSQPTVVPNRNMNFIAMLITVAWTHKLNTVVLGVHATDAGENHYPDCKASFIGAMNAAVEIGSEGRINLWAPFEHSSKGDIVYEASELGVPAQLTMSCYNGMDPACGQCATCHERLAAFSEAEYKDPIIYVDDVNVNGYPDYPVPEEFVE